jgi:hypothetical protein
MSPAETPERLYTIEELVELRRNTMRYARSVPAGDERNKHRQLAVSLRALFRGEKWLQTHTQEGWCRGQGTKAATSNWRARGNSMQKFFFDMKDGVPLRDRVGIEFKTNADAIAHCKVIAQHFRDESLRDDQDLEISVVNALGREIHLQFVHRT